MKKFDKLKKELDRIKKMGWMKCEQKNIGEVGLKLEKLLNKNPGNFEIPDYDDIEIKTKSSLREKSITLFNATPDSYLFEIKRLHGLYGYPYSKMRQYKLLNNIVSCRKRTYIYNDVFFSLKVLWDKRVINLIVTNRQGEVIDNLTSWSFDMIEEKLNRKMKYLCYVEVNKYYENGQMYIKYNNDHYYVSRGFDCFIRLIERGVITITFKIGVFQSGKRKGQIHDHGTSFSIHENDLELLYKKEL